jgi:hypothetical protein
MQWLINGVRLLFAVVGVAIGSLVFIAGIAEFQDGTLANDLGTIAEVLKYSLIKKKWGENEVFYPQEIKK